MVEVLWDSVLRDRLKTAGLRRVKDFDQKRFLEGYRRLVSS
jgi:hypothetical protein